MNGKTTVVEKLLDEDSGDEARDFCVIRSGLDMSIVHGDLLPRGSSRRKLHGGDCELDRRTKAYLHSDER